MTKLALSFFLLLAALAEAQQTAITGTITDSSGGSIPIAKVTATPKAAVLLTPLSRIPPASSRSRPSMPLII